MTQLTRIDWQWSDAHIRWLVSNFSIAVPNVHLVRDSSVLLLCQHFSGLYMHTSFSWRQVGFSDMRHFTEFSGQKSQFSSSLLSAHSTCPLHLTIWFPYSLNLHCPFRHINSSLSSWRRLFLDPFTIDGCLFTLGKISSWLMSKPTLCFKKPTLRL